MNKHKQIILHAQTQKNHIWAYDSKINVNLLFKCQQLTVMMLNVSIADVL